MIATRCIGYLASVVDNTKIEKIKPEDVPIVSEFIKVFPEDLPRLPPDQAITFEIELMPGMTPYRMALAELKEIQL